MNDEKQLAIEALRDAIQQCEEFGMVRDSSGKVVTGAIICDDGSIQIVKEW